MCSCVQRMRVQLVLPSAVLMENEEDEGCCSGGSMMILQLVSVGVSGRRMLCYLCLSLYICIFAGGHAQERAAEVASTVVLPD